MSDTKTENAHIDGKNEVYTIPELAVRGVIRLNQPIRSRSKDVIELHYDFSLLTSNDVVECLDKTPYANNDNTLNNTQARYLFARACKLAEREMSGVDEIDICNMLSPGDTIAAVRVGKSFFVHSLAAALSCISKM